MTVQQESKKLPEMPIYTFLKVFGMEQIYSLTLTKMPP